jgi:branched-chain amino acid transport system substrate-binding protein
MPEEKGVSRREFLKIAGITGATIGAAGGLGGLVAACGGTEETTTTAGPSTTAGATTTTAGATTTTAGATTTVSASTEAGREIKVGIVVPKTGPLAAFAGPFDWVHDQWTKNLAAGVVCGDGKNHPIKTYVADTQSDTNRCAQVTGDLIQNTKVDVVFAGGAPDTMNPAADVCEAMGTPGEMIQGPWQAFYFARGGTPDKNPFKWASALCVGIEAMAACFVDMWDKIETNKKAGLIFSNSTDGQAWSDKTTGGPFYFEKGGYTYSMPGLYQPGSEDYTQQISEFKKFGAEICSGAMTSGDFTNFWKQAIQQGFNPKLCTVGQALNFAETANAIGPTVVGLTTEISWHPDYPYKSSLTGQTCKEIADAYETDTGKQWSAEIIFYSLMEWFVAGLKNAANVDDKEALLKAIVDAKVETIYGPVDFSLPVDATAQDAVIHPVPNCLRMPTAGGQWLSGTKWTYEKFLVSNKFVPDAKVTTQVQAIKYTA